MMPGGVQVDLRRVKKDVDPSRIVPLNINTAAVLGALRNTVETNTALSFVCKPT